MRFFKSQQMGSLLFVFKEGNHLAFLNILLLPYLPPLILLASLFFFHSISCSFFFIVRRNSDFAICFGIFRQWGVLTRCSLSLFFFVCVCVCVEFSRVSS
jgi:hypothetical protein